MYVSEHPYSLFKFSDIENLPLGKYNIFLHIHREGCILTGILITGGEKPDFSSISSLFSDSYYLCAADSGLDYCLENSLTPDYILGDMDSLSDPVVLENFDSSIIETHPEDKDYTDTELGLMHLYNHTCTPVILIGGGGGRLDHLLAVIALFDKDRTPDRWIIRNEEIRLINDSFRGQGKQGELISLFPVGRHPCRMISRGLYWPLDDLTWEKGDSGISNRLTDSSFEIKMRQGRLIMIREIPPEGLLP